MDVAGERWLIDVDIEISHKCLLGRRVRGDKKLWRKWLCSPRGKHSVLMRGPMTGTGKFSASP